MDKNKLLEMFVSDAMTDKPIEFSITTKEVKPISYMEVAQEKRVIDKRFLCFMYQQTIVADVDVEKFRDEEVDVEHRFIIHPPKFGKMQVLSKYYLLLDIEEEAFEKEPHLEAMRVCEAKTDAVCDLMAVAVLNTQEELLDDDKVKELTEFFKWNAGPREFAEVILAIMVQVRYENFMTSIRLTKTLRQNRPTVDKGANRVE